MRIRSIKPEFWRSDDVNAMAIEDRLLFIGLWSYVDDNGVGVDRFSDVCADLFAHDLSVSPHDTLMRVQTGLDRLCEMGVIRRYAVSGKRFLEITNWKRHQKINRPSPGRYPTSDQADTIVHDGLTEPSVNPHESSLPGTGEQGNRGTGEQKEDREPTVRSTAIAATTPRPEIEQLCEHLADRIEANGSKRPSITRRWEDACRLMLDRDGRTTEQISYLIDWSQAHEFWKSNILSMPKLRDKFDQLRLQATAKPGGQSKSDQRAQNILRMVEDMEGEPGGHESNWRGAGVHQSA